MIVNIAYSCLQCWLFSCPCDSGLIYHFLFLLFSSHFLFCLAQSLSFMEERSWQKQRNDVMSVSGIAWKCDKALSSIWNQCFGMVQVCCFKKSQSRMSYKILLPLITKLRNVRSDNCHGDMDRAWHSCGQFDWGPPLRLWELSHNNTFQPVLNGKMHLFIFSIFTLF